MRQDNSPMELFKPLDTQVRQAPDSHPVDFGLSKTHCVLCHFRWPAFLPKNANLQDIAGRS